MCRKDLEVFILYFPLVKISNAKIVFITVNKKKMYLFDTITLNMSNLLALSIIYIISKCHKKIENFPIG